MFRVLVHGEHCKCFAHLVTQQMFRLIRSTLNVSCVIMCGEHCKCFVFKCAVCGIFRVCFVLSYCEIGYSVIVCGVR
jgi:hypothetical protein